MSEEKSEAAAGPAPRTTSTSHVLGEWDLHLFNEGRHRRLYDKLGAHLIEVDGQPAVAFAVWAPNAQAVSVIGDFNGWTPGAHPLSRIANSGIFAATHRGIAKGAHYKYHVISQHAGYQVAKTDPFGFHHEVAPSNASIVWDLDYTWSDGAWMASRREKHSLRAPMSIYEVHLGSFRRVPEEEDRYLTYRELAPLLADHVERLGFTHVELMPVMEHPYYPSWGYQVTGYFAPTSRYGTPQDLMFMIDVLHQRGIGVIVDWVPAHFPTDEHGLGYFDGTHLYEHEDPRQGFHPDWKSCIFNYGRHEVQSFLTSSALFWLDRYHIDGLRVDGVASMLYLDYSREHGEWIPNRHGGRENLEAIALLKQINEAVYEQFPDVQTIAEESTAWPGVSRPTHVGGLGFGLKWDMGWMHDTLAYLHEDPIRRKYHHEKLTFRPMYAFSENFVLPLSHDEVVHGKGSLYGKMPGDHWQKLANLRLLYAYMFAQPGKKLLFMGAELGQEREWAHERSLDFHLEGDPGRAGLMRVLSDLNRVYREHPALHELDAEGHGFRWINFRDADQCVIAFERHALDETTGPVIVVCNFTPVVRHDYHIGVARPGRYLELFNTDSEIYGGSGQGNLGSVESLELSCDGHPHALSLTLPPLAALFLQRATDAPDEATTVASRAKSRRS
jgi:1,4-alpha-glucan branching enzyme